MPMIRAHFRRHRTYRARRPSTRSDYPYEQREALLSRGELAFFRALMGAIRGAYLVSLKTRLADVVKCPDHLWDSVHGRRLSQKHVDFVLYDPITTAIRAVVELDDRSHDEPERQRATAFWRMYWAPRGLS